MLDEMKTIMSSTKRIEVIDQEIQGIQNNDSFAGNASFEPGTNNS